MKKNYRQLNQFDRDRIEAMLLAGHQQKEIANVLGRDPATIGREIKRNRRKLRKLGGHKDGPYIASVANHKSYVRRKYAKYQGMKIIGCKELEDYIIDKLKLHWSPDEISGRMKQEKQSFYASKDLIYAWIYSAWGQKYAECLYSKRNTKRKRKSKKSLKIIIPNRIGIECRPIKANQRKTFGHYEIDTLVSGKASHSKESLAVVYERKARYIDVRKIKSLSPKQLNIGVNKIFNNINQKETATFDNGFENREHQLLNIQTYFCDPYSSWQKGGVENANKMIRRYIPKGSDISNYSHQYITMIIKRINKKPRKSLGYKTPLEVMLENNLLINPRKQKVALGG